MKTVVCLLCVAVVSTQLYAKDKGDHFSVSSTVYSDGVLLMLDQESTDLQVTVSGPGNMRFTQDHLSTDAVFIDIKYLDGQILEDGLYKYSISPKPAVTYTREESAAMPDRNDLKAQPVPEVERVSGSFRVVNGQIPDTGLMEFGAYDNKGVQQ